MRRLIIAIAAFVSLFQAMPSSYAASTFTSCLQLEDPNPGEQSGSWGITENTGRQLVDTAIAGILNLSVAGAANVTLTSVAGATDQARNRLFIFTGLLTGNIQILWPNGLCRFFTVTNSTTGAFTVTLEVNNGAGGAAGTTQTIAQSTTQSFYSDGTNILPLTTAGAGGISSLTQGTGLTFSVNPITATGTISLTVPVVVANGGTGATVAGATASGNIGAMAVANNGSDINNAATFRTNLGLGAASLIGTPVTVANGGQGSATLAAHGVLIGNATSPVNVTGTGTLGQVLTSNGAAADPTFKTPASVTGTLTAGTSNVMNPVVFGSSSSQAHGLGGVPAIIVWKLQCLTGEGAYSIGDVIMANGLSTSGGGGYGFDISADGTNSVISVSSAGLVGIKKDGSGIFLLTAANWEFIAIPYKIN